MPLADLVRGDHAESSSHSSGDAHATPDSEFESDSEDLLAVQAQDSTLLEDDFLREDAQTQYLISRPSLKYIA